MTTESTTADLVEVLGDGQLQVRLATVVTLDDGTVIGPAYHRYVLEPGAALDGQPTNVTAIATAVWTADVLTAWAASTSAAQQADQGAATSGA